MNPAQIQQIMGNANNPAFQQGVNGGIMATSPSNYPGLTTSSDGSQSPIPQALNPNGNGLTGGPMNIGGNGQLQTSGIAMNPGKPLTPQDYAGFHNVIHSIGQAAPSHPVGNFMNVLDRILHAPGSKK